MVIYVLLTVAALLAQSVAGEDKSRAPHFPGEPGAAHEDPRCCTSR